MIEPRLKSGDDPGFDGTEQSFENLFRRLYDPLVRYACMHVSDADEAEDIVQQLFVKFWQQRREIKAIHPKSYLYRSVYNECVNRARHAQVKGAYMENHLRELNEGSATATEVAEEKELEKRISAALDKLPEQCGKAFKLSRFHHLSYAEIAEVMQISVKTVENHMGKALMLMRGHLSDYLISVFLITLNFIAL